MTIQAGTILIVRPSSSGSNGGAFNPTNANMATDGAATSATGASPVFSSASYNFVANDVGYRVFIKSGTNWTPGWYTIASVAGGAATLTAGIGTATLYGATPAAATGVSAVVGCATVASPTGATWSVDYSNADTGLSVTGLNSTDGSTTFTAASVGKNFVGNYIYSPDGDATFAEIISTSGTTATISNALSDGSGDIVGGSGTLGGALATLLHANSTFGSGGVAGTSVFVKSGSYSVTAAQITTTSGGTLAKPYLVEGFGTIPKDLAAKPVFTRTSGSFTFASLATNSILRNVSYNGAGSSVGCSGANMATFDRVDVSNCATGFTGLYLAWRCTATGCTSVAFGSTTGTAVFCEAYANSCTGFLFTTGRAVWCISSGNTGGSSHGFSMTPTSTTVLDSCIAYGNGGNGFLGTTGVLLCVSCLAESNAGYQFTATAATGGATLLNCGAFNGSGLGNFDATKITTTPTGFVSNTTGSFFTNAASGDFSLNNTANQGATARAAGFPGLMPRGLSTGYQDIGAIQHADPASGGVSGARIFTGF